MHTQKVVLVFFVVGLCGVLGVPKKYQQDEGLGSKKYEDVSTFNGFEPSHRYYESDLRQQNYQKPVNASKPERKESKESRFGILPIGSSYGGSAPGGGYGTTYAIAPAKIELGGVVLGALIGLGAVLIIPKVAHLLGGGYGGYRSLENEMASVSNILARIDNSLEQNNIDSNSCIQRIICSYVNDVQKDMANGEANGIDELIAGFTNNTLFSFMLDGTAIKQAVDLGKAGDAEKCTSQFPKCPITRNNIAKIIGSLLPA